MTNAHENAGVVIEDLNLSFGDTHVLKGVDLTIKQGEFFAFLGPSGSGKSTLLRAIAGFGPTPSGRILIQDHDVADLPPWKRDVGMVFQSYALWPHMTVRKNVAFGLEERKRPQHEINERVDRALDMVGLLDYADRRPSQLSGGQQQRIALARTIVIEPKVLLLDEPLSNLDANLRIQMRRDIRDLQQKLKLTTIFVTHDQEEANTTSDRMAVLDQGVIQQVGAPIDLYDKPANLFVAKFLGTANILKGSVITDESSLVFRTDRGMDVPLSQGYSHGRSIVFRPQNVDVCAAGTGGGDAHAKLNGNVEHMEFLGSIIRYGVDVNGDLVLVDHAHKRGEDIFHVGESVDLLIDRESILVLAA
ncbi:ABC transporter ATP-binding protein [Magnetovibrio sp.]|uniref:ABC transporter ATP-binding protein n=1 Tax=Magnetovibrio sp. TaxID=2024836 RepID=UPI002F94E9E6